MMILREKKLNQLWFMLFSRFLPQICKKMVFCSFLPLTLPRLSHQYALALSLIYIIISCTALYFLVLKVNEIEYASFQQEPAAQVVNNSGLDASKRSADHLNKKSASRLKIESEEATVHTSISASDILILDSSSNPRGKRADLSRKVKV